MQAVHPAFDTAAFLRLASDGLDDLSVMQRMQRVSDCLHQVLALAPPLSINPTYLVFAKQARQQALLQRFDQILLEMRADGSLDKLVQQAVGSE